MPQNCSNQRKSVFPAVCANGRFNVGSRGPGACPIIITPLMIGPPETGVERMRGQRRHRSNAATYLSSNSWRLALGMAATYCAISDFIAIAFGEADPPT